MTFPQNGTTGQRGDLRPSSAEHMERNPYGAGTEEWQDSPGRTDFPENSIIYGIFKTGQRMEQLTTRK